MYGRHTMERERLLHGFGLRAAGVLALLFTSSNAHAQLWSSTGLLLAPSPTTPSAVVSDSTGGMYVIWSTYQGPQPQLFVSRRLNDGSLAPGWPAEGLAVCPDSRQLFYGAAPDGGGGLLLCWQDLRGTSPPRPGFFAQHIRSNATRAWPDTGLRIVDRVVGDKPFVLSDGNDGAFVVWLNNAALDTLRAHHLTSAGALDPSWPAGGLVLCSSGNSRGPNSLIVDGGGGGLFLWHDARFGDADVFAQRFTAAGAIPPGWPANGAAVAVGSGDQFYPVGVPDGAGGAIVAFEDWRDAGQPAISLQHVRGDGSIGGGLPSDGVVVSTATGTRGSPTAVSDDAGGIYVAWEDTRNGPANVYVLRADSNCTTLPGWTANGTRLCPLLHVQTAPALTRGGFGDLIVAWGDRRNDLDDDVYLQDLLAGGAPRPGWPATGQSVCTFPGDQNRPMVAGDDAGGALVVWHDTRSGGDDLYGGHVGQDGIVPTLLSLVSARCDDGVVALDWFAESTESIHATLERRTDASGWSARDVLSADGTGHVRYQDSAVIAGDRYGYRLTWFEGGGERSTEATWVRVPGSRFALSGPQPNPAAGPFRIEFSLANADPATLEVTDAAGRRVARREIGSLGPGSHRVTLRETDALPPGIYLLTLKQGARVLHARGAVLR